MTRFCNLTRQLGRDRSGAVAVIFAILFPVVAGILGLGIETGIWYAIKRQDQSAADIAAYSGALEIVGVLGGATALTSAQITQVQTAAKADALTNGFNFADSANTASTVAVSGTTVTVTLRHDETPKMVSYFLGKNTFEIANRAVASVTSFPACASSVGGSGVGLSMNGNTTLSTPNCTLTSNSAAEGDHHVYAIEVGGGATVDAAGIYTVGAIDSGPNSTLPASLVTGAKPLVDPYCKFPPTTDCMRVPASVTGFTMPDLASTVTTPLFPSVATTAPKSDNTTYPKSPQSNNINTTPPTCNGSNCTASSSLSDIKNFSYFSSPTGVTLTGTGNKCDFKANSSIIFAGPVTIATGASCTIESGVDFYVASGDFTVAAGGSLTVAANGGKPNGSKALSNIWVKSGTFDASLGRATFTGDSGLVSNYALQASGGFKFGNPTTGNPTFGGGQYAFYGNTLRLGAASGTNTTLGVADYYVDAGGVSIVSGGTATFSASTNSTTYLTLGNSGSFTSAGTTTFNNTGITGVSYFLNAAGYTLTAGSTTFGANTSFGLYGGGLAESSGANMGINAGANFYLDSGSLALNGCAAFQAGTTTINVNGGSLTSSSTLSTDQLYFNPNTSVCGVSYTNGTSQYNIKTSAGMTLGGPTTFNAGTYYFEGAGLAVNGGTSGSPSTFGATGNYFVQTGNFSIGGSATVTLNAAGYSVQNGNFSVASGGTANFTAATGVSCGTLTASCLYVKAGTISNAGTATFATGNYYLYDSSGSGTSTGFTNSGTMTLGTTASSNFYINNGGRALVNTGTVNFGAGTYYIQDGTDANGQNRGGFASSGTLTFTGGSGSNYYFINGPSFGTGSSSGSCASASSTTYGALSILPSATANFGPANYYLLNGDLCINQKNGAAPTLSCTGCTNGAGITFILTGSSAGNVSTLQIADVIDSHLSKLTAPSGTPDGTPGTVCASPYTVEGCYSGVLFFQDPYRDGSGVAQTSAGTISGNSCDKNPISNCSLLDGGDNMALGGAAYVPQSVLDFQSNNSANTCLVLIAQSLLFTGTSDFLSASTCNPNVVKTLISTAVAWIL